MIKFELKLIFKMHCVMNINNFPIYIVGGAQQPTFTKLGSDEVHRAYCYRYYATCREMLPNT